MVCPPVQLLAGLLLLLSACQAPSARCDRKTVARIPIEVQDRLMVARAGLNGHWVRLLVDTGAERTVLSQGVADRLGLQVDARFTRRSIGVGGMTVTRDVVVDRFVLGGARFPLTRIAAGGFTLRTAGGLHADGLLGADVLLGFDTDIDVAGRVVTLYRPGSCDGAPPPWVERPTEIIGVGVQRDRLLLPFVLDGVGGVAVLDTGAQTNVVGLDMAGRLGLTPQGLAHDPQVRQQGVGPRATFARLHQFGLLRVGATMEVAPALTVLPSEAGVGDALLGEPFMRGRRVWLSLPSRRVFVTLRPTEQ